MLLTSADHEHSGNSGFTCKNQPKTCNVQQKESQLSDKKMGCGSSASIKPTGGGMVAKPADTSSYPPYPGTAYPVVENVRVAEMKITLEADDW